MSEACWLGSFLKGSPDDMPAAEVFEAGCVVTAGSVLYAAAGAAAGIGVLSLVNEVFWVGALRRRGAGVVPVSDLDAEVCCCILGFVSGGVTAALTELLVLAEAACWSTACTLNETYAGAHSVCTTCT